MIQHKRITIELFPNQRLEILNLKIDADRGLIVNQLNFFENQNILREFLSLGGYDWGKDQEYKSMIVWILYNFHIGYNWVGKHCYELDFYIDFLGKFLKDCRPIMVTSSTPVSILDDMKNSYLTEDGKYEGVIQRILQDEEYLILKKSL